DAPLARHAEHGVEATGGFFGEPSGAERFDVEEGVSQPEAGEIAAVGGQGIEPARVTGQPFPGGGSETGKTEVEPDRDERPPVRRLEITGMARTDPDGRVPTRRGRIAGGKVGGGDGGHAHIGRENEFMAA